MLEYEKKTKARYWILGVVVAGAGTFFFESVAIVFQIAYVISAIGLAWETRRYVTMEYTSRLSLAGRFAVMISNVIFGIIMMIVGPVLIVPVCIGVIVLQAIPMWRIFANETGRTTKSRR